jgi:LuxR family maltose regulon positive regulatory protein
LINTIASIHDHFVVILDDYHCIENPAIHEALAFLIDYLPPQMHVILAGRQEPPLPLARWRARGQLLELHADELRFLEHETQTLFNQAVNARLSAEDTHLLQERTEGWAAGLYLAALTVTGLAEAAAANVLRDFRGDHYYILDYLAAEVLHQQPEPLRSFLLQTAILDYLQADVCQAITGQSDSRLVLEQLEQRHLFIVPLDGKRQTYRYHHLFADFLRSQLQQTQPGQLPTLHLKAAAWYEQQNNLDQAIQHTLAARHFTEAARLIESIALQRLMRGELNTLLGWFKAIPAEVSHTRPLSCLYYAWALTHAGQLDTAAHYLDLFDRSAAAQEDYLRGQKAAIQARMAVVRGDAVQTINFCQRALALLPPNDLALRSEISLDLAFAQDQAPHNFEATRQAFETAITLSQTAGNPRAALMAGYYLANVFMRQGRFQAAAQLHHQSLQWLQRQASTSASACWAYVGLGILLYEWNNLPEALDHVQHGLELARQSGEVKVLIYGHTALACLWQAQGEPDRAMAALQAADEVAQQTNITSLINDTALNRVKLWLRQGQVETAVNWAQTRGWQFDPRQPDSFENSILIRLAIVQNQVAAPIIDLLKQRCDQAQTNAETWALIRHLIVLALAHHAQKQVQPALAALTQALTLAQPAGLKRAFIDEGQAMAVLLRQVATGGPAADYAAQLLAAFAENAPPSAAHRAAVKREPIVEPLRQREIEVLRLIAAGYSSQEIADEMILAVSTVKWHLKNIYEKLQVSRRTQALAKAKALNLL